MCPAAIIFFSVVGVVLLLAIVLGVRNYLLYRYNLGYSKGQADGSLDLQHAIELSGEDGYRRGFDAGVAHEKEATNPATVAYQQPEVIPTAVKDAIDLDDLKEVSAAARRQEVRPEVVEEVEEIKDGFLAVEGELHVAKADPFHSFYLEGVDARVEGCDEKDNPYLPGGLGEENTTAAEYWAKGWKTAIESIIEEEESSPCPSISNPSLASATQSNTTSDSSSSSLSSSVDTSDTPATSTGKKAKRNVRRTKRRTTSRSKRT